MNSMQRLITMGNDMQNRTLSPVGAEYSQKLRSNPSKYTLSDAKGVSGAWSEYSKPLRSLVLSVLILLVSLFIPLYSVGNQNYPLHASDYAQASSDYLQLPDFERLADAVYLAEGGAKAKVPYGIFFKGCSKSTPDYCRRIAINTFKSSHKRFLSTNSSQTFLEHLASTYAPVGVKNDPSGLNRNWIKNVNYFLKGRGVS